MLWLLLEIKLDWVTLASYEPKRYDCHVSLCTRPATFSIPCHQRPIAGAISSSTRPHPGTLHACHSRRCSGCLVVCEEGDAVQPHSPNLRRWLQRSLSECVPPIGCAWDPGMFLSSRPGCPGTQSTGCK